MVFILPQRCIRHISSKASYCRNRTILLHTSSIQFSQKETEGPKKRVVLDKQSSSDHTISVFERLQKEEPTALTTTQKVVENTKTTINLFVIIGGLGVVLYLVYMVTSEMFSSVSPSSIFKMCMKKIMANERANMILGDKIKGFGDPNSRTRKRLEHQPFVVAGVDYVRVRFHVEGTKRSGVVICDLKKAKNGWKTRAIIIHLDGFPPGKLTVEDNSLETDSEDLPDIDYSEFAFDNEESDK